LSAGHHTSPITLSEAELNDLADCISVAEIAPIDRDQRIRCRRRLSVKLKGSMP
jgi:hypothetical protein